MKTNPNIIRIPETAIAPVLLESGKQGLSDRRAIVVEVVKKDTWLAVKSSELRLSASETVGSGARILVV